MNFYPNNKRLQKKNKCADLEMLLNECYSKQKNLYNILKKLPKSLDNEDLILETSKLVTCDHYQSIKSLLSETNIKPDI